MIVFGWLWFGIIAQRCFQIGLMGLLEWSWAHKWFWLSRWLGVVFLMELFERNLVRSSNGRETNRVGKGKEEVIEWGRERERERQLEV